MSDLGDFIRTQRLAAGLTQREVQARAGFGPTVLSQIEHGRTVLPSVAIRRSLAAALGVTHIDLLIAAGEISAEEVAEARVNTEIDNHVRQLADEHVRALCLMVHSLDPTTLALIGELATADRGTFDAIANLAAVI